MGPVQCCLPVAGSVWQVAGSQVRHGPVCTSFALSGVQPGAKFELPNTRVSGTRSPLVSTRTEPIRLASARPVVLHGMGVAGKVKFPTSSSLLALRDFPGFTGM